jgi:hypothetical protein
MQVVIIKPDIDLSQEIMQDGTIVRRTVLLTVNQAQLRKAGSVTPMCSVLNLDLAMSAFLSAVDNTSDMDSVRCCCHLFLDPSVSPHFGAASHSTGCSVQVPFGLPVASECRCCGHATSGSYAHRFRSYVGSIRISVERRQGKRTCPQRTGFVQ